MYVCIYVSIYVSMCVCVWRSEDNLWELVLCSTMGVLRRHGSKHFYSQSQSEGPCWVFQIAVTLFFVPYCFPDLLHSRPCVVYARPHFFGSLHMASWYKVLYILCFLGLPGRAVPRSTGLAGSQPSSSEHSQLNEQGSVGPSLDGRLYSSLVIEVKAQPALR